MSVLPFTPGWFSRRSWAVLAAGVTAFLNIYGLQTLLPTLAQSFAASSQAVSLTISATTLAVALFSPLAGLVTSRLSRKRQVAIAVAGLSVCGMAGALAPDLPMLLATRFLLGLFLPLLVAAVMGMIADEWTGSDLGRGTSLYIASTVFGGFFGRFLTGQLGGALGWRAAIFILALANAAVGCFLLAQMRDQPASRARLDWREWGRAWRLPGLPSALFAGFSVLFCLIGTFSYISFHLSSAPFSLGPAALGSLSCVYLVGGSITPFAGRLFARWGYAGALRRASVLGLAGALLTLALRLELVILGLICCSTATFISQAAATGWVTRHCAGHRAAAMGLYLSAYYLGGCCGAALPGFFWGVAAWPGCVALFAAMQLGLSQLARRLSA